MARCGWELYEAAGSGDLSYPDDPLDLCGSRNKSSGRTGLLCPPLAHRPGDQAQVFFHVGWNDVMGCGVLGVRAVGATAGPSGNPLLLSGNFLMKDLIKGSLN